MAARKVEIDIFGQSFSVMAEDEASLREAASYVDRQMKDLSRTSTSVDSFRLAVLTALNIANERNEIVRQAGSKDALATERVEAMNKKAERLVQTMDEVLGPE